MHGKETIAEALQKKPIQCHEVHGDAFDSTMVLEINGMKNENDYIVLNAYPNTHYPTKLIDLLYFNRAESVAAQCTDIAEGSLGKKKTCGLDR